MRLMVICALAILAAPPASDVPSATPVDRIGRLRSGTLALGLILVRTLIEAGPGIPATPQA